MGKWENSGSDCDRLHRRLDAMYRLLMEPGGISSYFGVSTGRRPEAGWPGFDFDSGKNLSLVQLRPFGRANLKILVLV